MNDEQILDKLSGVFKEILGIKEFELSITMDEVQEWDSLKHIQLLSSIEETFKIEIPFEDVIEMISVESIINKIKKYVVKNKNMFTKQGLPPHQLIKSDINILYKNVGELFQTKTQQTPEKLFLICPGKKKDTFSYRSFNSKYLLVVRYLIQLGLEKGNRFNIIFSNSPEFLLFYFSGLTLGITVVPINPDIAPEEMRYIIEDSSSKAVFYDAELGNKIEQIANIISPRIILKDILPIPNFEPFQLNDTGDKELSIPEIELEDEAVIIYTSGTTGNPKGVVLSHLNLLADAKAISEWFQFSSETRTLCILPLFHNNGQITTLLAPLYAGGSTVIVKGKASLMAFWGLIEEYKATWTSVMASILSILLSLPIERKDRTLQGILCGGQVLTKNVQEEFENRFEVPIFEGYGLTETTSFSCINDYPAEKRKMGSIGKPLPTNEMTILDEHGDELGPNIEGEINIRGYNVACEYLGLKANNRESFSDGWFHSGDYGKKDDDGYFYFHGRKDSLIIKGGENIYPAELENVLYKHPAVSECAVIGIPDKLLGEDICAFVKLHDNTDISEQELKEFCKGKIAAYKQAKKIFLIDGLDDLDEIPKGPTKKILYRRLKEYFANKMHPVLP